MTARVFLLFLASAAALTVKPTRAKIYNPEPLISPRPVSPPAPFIDPEVERRNLVELRRSMGRLRLMRRRLQDNCPVDEDACAAKIRKLESLHKRALAAARSTLQVETERTKFYDPLARFNSPGHKQP